MFYSQEILQRRGGTFGIVWLAATRAAALTKRDYYSVHVAKICDDLLKHITMRIFHHGSKQRFSLYLSSQLMFGITKVYGKQADYLLIEVQRLHRQFSSTRLMLAEYMEDDCFQLPRIPKSMGTHTLPPPDLDQFSGELHLQIPQPHFFEEEYISSRSLRGLAMSFKSPDRAISPIPGLQEFPDIQAHIVSNIDEITLKEDITPHPMEFQVPGGDDFGGMLVHDMEARLAEVPMPAEDELMVFGDVDQAVQTPLGEEQMWAIEEQTGKVVLSPGQEKKASAKKTREPRMPASPEEALPEQVLLSPVVEATKESSDEGPPEFRTPLSPSGQAVDVPILRLAAIREQELSPTSGRGSGRKRKRQLLFVDPKTQLSKSQMRTNMADFEDILEKDILANPEPILGARDLFREPARKAAARCQVFKDLWLEGTNVDPPPEEDPDKVWSTDYLREPEMMEGSSSEYDLPEVPKLEMSAEQWRAAEESRVSSKMEDTPASFSLTDTSRLSQSREGSRSRRGSFLQESGTLPRKERHEDIIEEELVAALQPEVPQTEEFMPPDLSLIREEGVPLIREKGVPLISEEGVQVEGEVDFTHPQELSTSEDEEKIGVPHEQLFEKISELASETGDVTTFQDLVPLSTDRKIAAKIFAICLEYAKEGLVTLEQSRPYADISIYPKQRQL